MARQAKADGNRKTRQAQRRGQKAGAPRPRRISPLRKPQDMTLEQWQIALRRQSAREQRFRVENIGKESIFSEFSLNNPKTDGRYRVAIRGPQAGDNYCSCPDFAVNALGTCKHIEFVLAKLGRRPAGRRTLAAGFHPAYSEVYLRYGAQRQVTFRPGTDCPRSLRDLAGGYFDGHGALRPEAHGRFETFLKDAGRIDHDLRCYDDALAFIAQVRDQDLLRQRVDKAFPKGIESTAFKDLLKVSLYSYQCQGALFAARAGRSLIADDMGLGKTIEAIAAVEILARTVGLERVLIICPTSLKHQWKAEIEKFSSRTAVVVEGLAAGRARLLREDSFFKVINYDVVHRDIEEIARWQPEMIILDEAQRIKNWKTRAARTVKRLQSRYALVLTGTPLENRLEELHSIVEVVDRFRLGPLFRFLDAHQHVDENGRVIGYHHLDGISKTLAPILIRRTKQQVLKELPERLEKNYFVPMTAEQSKHHQENQDTVARIVAKWRRFGFLSETDRMILQIALQNMRMSCNSTYLLDQTTDYGVKADELMSVLGECFEQPDTKAVVFSQWLRTHEILEGRLGRRGYQYVLFHGGIPGRQRKDLIGRFKTDPDCRLFLSTDAGGVGLNLQNASVVVNMDLPWNPAVLEQRIGRVHRLGQHRPVRVVNFVAQGTIEHGMLSLLAFKKSLFSGVLDDGQGEVFLGGTRLKRFMEGVEKATGAIPEPMPQQEQTAKDTQEAAQEVGEQAESAQPTAKPAAAQRPLAPVVEDLLTTGLSFLEKLSQVVSSQGPATGSGPSHPVSIETDQATGKHYLRLPVPDTDVLRKITSAMADILKRLGG